MGCRHAQGDLEQALGLYCIGVGEAEIGRYDGSNYESLDSKVAHLENGKDN